MDGDAWGMVGQTEVRARCPKCGVVDVPAETSFVALHKAGDLCVTRCPQCSLTLLSPISGNVVELLADCGVPVGRLVVPAEFLEGRRQGPPITLDDVRRFRRALTATMFVSTRCAVE